MRLISAGAVEKRFSHAPGQDVSLVSPFLVLQQRRIVKSLVAAITIAADNEMRPYLPKYTS